jgi:hypothetical protein
MRLYSQRLEALGTLMDEIMGKIFMEARTTHTTQLMRGLYSHNDSVLMLIMASKAVK